MSQLDINMIVKEDAILKVMVTDLSGSFKEIISHTSRLNEIVSSGMAYDGSSFSGINSIESSDSILVGVPETLVQIPQKFADSEKAEYMIICNIQTVDHQPHPNCARSQLVRLQTELERVWGGGKLFMGSEPESYFISHEQGFTKGGGNSNYFNPKDPRTLIITEISNVLNQMNFEIERAHTEVGDEQFETNWKYDRAERNADRIQYYKLMVHKVARKFGYDVTFLPKPYHNRNGSGMHCHVSVQSDKENLFYDAESTDMNFSVKGLQFLTGILSSSRALAAITNPTEVSYARLVPGFEAPVIASISAHNRSAACRVPAIADATTKSKALRAEFRFPDPLTNPYLMSAGFIAAGLGGIEQQLPFPGFVNINFSALSPQEIKEQKLTMLPRNLWEAYQEYSNNQSLADKLGTMHQAYADIVLEEIDDCQSYANTRSVHKHYLA
ncbi:MAG: hypothetical protein CMI53_00965 [Parcubacteria group bacterium]|nr:hypothetical protein [Parcubacteria group bacterium]|tara:strand:- start:8817 stop:10142 length:1326 start_codon:yes stop_codon:yes gene_type:complete